MIPTRAPTQPDETPPGRDAQFATTLARGLEILKCFGADRPVLSNRQLAAFTGLSKPTVSRLTYTLVQLGYLRNDPNSGKYQLGTAVLTLSYPLLANIPLRQLVRFPMRALADKLGGSVSLGMRDRLSIVYVETSRSHSLQSPQLSDIGMSHPIIASANGRAYLAGTPPAQREQLLNEIRIKMPEFWDTYSAPALRSIEKWQELGFCYSYDGYRPDVCTVGVPFRSSHQSDLYVFNCVLHSHAVKRGQLESEVGPSLLAMVRGLGGVV